MRVAFLGSPPFATPALRHVLESRHDVAMLVTPPERRSGRSRTARNALVELAETHGVPVLRPADPHAPEPLAELRAREPDVLLVASYGVLLKQALLELAPHGCLNVHASLLPRHRGASPIQYALLCGDAETGVTVQRIVPALDEGDVLVSMPHAIDPDETAGGLLEQLAELGGRAAVEALDRLDSGAAQFVPQDPDQATYAPKLKKTDGVIDWTRGADELERLVRAMNPWPTAQTRLPDGRELQVLAARVAEAPGREPGALVEASGRLVVACGSGALELLVVKPAGKRAMPSADFLRGTRLEVGAKMGR